MTVPAVTDGSGRRWQYHSRSDQHSKVACWAILFDLLQTSSLLRGHLDSGKVAFGINRQINDWSTGRRKDLDLVVARSSTDRENGTTAFDLSVLARRYSIILEPEEQAELDGLPVSSQGAAGSTVLVALEAKACMTAHIKALPRLYDELTSSHSTVHGDNVNALAIGFVMVNMADAFISPGRQAVGGVDVINKHRQPLDTERTLSKVREINRRSGPHSGQPGFDALGVLVLSMQNDGGDVELVTGNPAPQPSDDFYYDRMVTRAAHLYDSSFGNV
jgi:hypothetical protein